MNDPRFQWGNRYILISQDPTQSSSQKVGLWSPQGWAAYVRHQHLFFKLFHPQQAESIYPDRGANVEVFVNSQFLELETLAPMTLLNPGSITEHYEEWWLEALDSSPRSEDEVETIYHQTIRPKLIEDSPTPEC